MGSGAKAGQVYSGSEICSKQAHEVVAMLRKGEVSPAELIDAAFSRMAAVEPAVNAMPITCRARAEAATKALDDGMRDHPGWLAGLPVGIKDLVAVSGTRFTSGAKPMADFVPEESDPLVSLIEKRGGIVVGKTNTPEFGAGGNTFNSVFGRTRNPWDTRLNAAGSSGGAAVSLATGEVWLSHGSDNGGSLRTPAAYNGIVGLRPSPGMCGSSSNAAFLIEGQEGPMARSVRDCALFLDAMTGFNPAIPTSFPPPAKPYQQSVIEADGKVRIGFAADLGGYAPVEPVIDAAMRHAMNLVESNGGVVEEVCPDLPRLESTYHILRGLNMVAAFKHAPESLTRHLKATITENIAFGRTLSADQIADAHVNRTVIFRNMYDYLQKFDVLACATVGNMPRLAEMEWVDEINGIKLGGYMDWLKFAFLATVAGLPAISVPIGFSDDGLPIGVQLIGPPRGEAKLLAVAAAVELAVGGPNAPIDPNLRH